MICFFARLFWDNRDRCFPSDWKLFRATMVNEIVRGIADVRRAIFKTYSAFRLRGTKMRVRKYSSSIITDTVLCNLQPYSISRHGILFGNRWSFMLVIRALNVPCGDHCGAGHYPATDYSCPKITERIGKRKIVWLA